MLANGTKTPISRDKNQGGHTSAKPGCFPKRKQIHTKIYTNHIHGPMGPSTRLPLPRHAHMVTATRPQKMSQETRTSRATPTPPSATTLTPPSVTPTSPWAVTHQRHPPLLTGVGQGWAPAPEVSVDAGKHQTDLLAAVPADLWCHSWWLQWPAVNCRRKIMRTAQKAILRERIHTAFIIVYH